MEALMSILMDAFFIALLSWCGISDMKKRLIPNLAIAILLCLGVAHVGLMVIIHNTWWTYPAGLVFTIPFFIAWMRNSLGAGDVKLVMAVALYLGLLNTLVSYALMIPVLVGLTVRSWLKNRTVKHQIPFAPIIAFGAFGAVLLGYLYVLI